MNRRNRRLRATLLIVAMVVIVGAGLALEATHALRTTELSSVDERFKVRGTQPAPSNVVIVAIDDKTFNDLQEHFPFRRRWDARVISQLTKAKPAAIAYDVQFTEKTTDEDDARLILAVRAARNVVLATTEVSDTGTTNIFGGAGRTAACPTAAASRPTRTTASTWTTGSARCRSACSAWSASPSRPRPPPSGTSPTRRAATAPGSTSRDRPARSPG